MKGIAYEGRSVVECDGAVVVVCVVEEVSGERLFTWEER